MNKIILESVNSTNTYAKENSKKIKENIVIVAKEQKNGYGTNNRIWFSSKDSIICSFFIKNIKKTITSEYSYEVGNEISKMINNLFNINTYIKKPNDIFYNNKKIGGILIETKYNLNNLEYIIIGIGLNINQEKFPLELKNIATSLFIETKIKFDKEKIIKELIKVINKKIIN